MLSLRKSASAMNLRKTDRSELNLFPALSFLVVCFIGGYFLWATKDALPSEADNTDFRYAPSRAKELAQELDSIYSCKSGPGMEEFLETWHRKYTSNAPAPDKPERHAAERLQSLYHPLQSRPDASSEGFSERFGLPLRRYPIAIDVLYRRGQHVRLLLRKLPPTFPTDGFTFSAKGAYYRVLDDFRPQIRQAGLKQLYLTDEYKDALELFLEKNGYWPDEERTSAESGRKRMRFLQNYWYVINGHWEGWHLGIPAIGYIVLNKSLDKAVAEVVEEYTGSGVLLQDVSGWKEVGGLIIGRNNPYACAPYSIR